MTAEEHIARAATALTRGQRVFALDSLIAAWVVCPCTRLGDLAVQLGKRLVSNEDVPDARTLAGHAAWMARAVEPDRVTLGALTENFVEGHAAEVDARIRAIAAWPADPRTSRAIVRALQAGAWSGPAYAKTRPRIAEVLSNLKDPAVVTGLRSLPRRGWYGSFAPLAAAIIAQTDERWPGLGSDLPGLDAVADALSQDAPDTAQLDDLLAQVHAAPDDDRPRLVYADAVAQLDPARAEFIVLQHQAKLRRDQRARIKELRETHERRWMGALEPVIRKAKWRRGFLFDAILRRPASAALKGFIGAPAWRTIEHIRFARHMADFEIPYELLFDNPPLRRVRTAHGFTARALSRLAALDGSWSLTAVGVHGFPPALAPTGGLREVRHLDVEVQRYRLLRASELMRTRVGDPFLVNLSSMSWSAEFPFEVAIVFDFASLHDYERLDVSASGWEYRFSDGLQRATLRKRGRNPTPSAFANALTELPKPIAEQLQAQYDSIT